MIIEAITSAKFPPTDKIVPPGTQTHVTEDLARAMEATGEWRIIQGHDIRQDVIAKRFHRQDAEPDKE